MLQVLENDFGKMYAEIFSEKKIAKITSLEVKKKEQNKGYGGLLVREFEELCEKSGIKEIKIDAYKKSLGFWEKQGFVLESKPQTIDGFKQDYYDGFKKIGMVAEMGVDSEQIKSVKDFLGKTQVCDMSSAESAVYFMEYSQLKEMMATQKAYTTIETYGAGCDIYTRLHFDDKKRGDFDRGFQTFKTDTLRGVFNKAVEEIRIIDKNEYVDNGNIDSWIESCESKEGVVGLDFGDLK
jgi:hypothetical protein